MFLMHQFHYRDDVLDDEDETEFSVMTEEQQHELLEVKIHENIYIA